MPEFGHEVRLNAESAEEARGNHGMEDILIALYYVAAIVVIVMHYIGWLEDRGLEWIVYVVAVLLFPMLWFAYLP